MQFKTVDSETIADILFGRSGLIVGPGATTNGLLYSELDRKLGGNDELQKVSSARALGRSIRERGLDEQESRQKVTEEYGKIPASPYLTTLARPNWKAVVSLSMDSYLEDRIQIENDKKPSRRPITKISDLAMSFPSRTTPAFKMLGEIGHPGCILYEEDYLRVRPTWRHALSSFCDILSGSPVLCLGVDGDTEAMLDLISEMLADKATKPSGIILLADDQLLNNRSFTGLTSGRIQVFVFKDSLSALVSRLSSQESVGRTRLLPLVDNEISLLKRYEEVCVIIDPSCPSSIGEIPKIALLDSMFSPSMPDWNPYFENLDFRREVESDLVAKVRDVARSSKGTHSCVAVTGSAAVGKTTLLKRIALQLASIPHLSIWITSSPVESPERFFHEFFRDLRQNGSDDNHAFCFVDDPIRSRSGEIDLLLNSAASFGFTITLVISARSSEWSTIDHGRMAGYSTSVADYILPDNFTTDELDRLPQYLLKIGAASDLANAEEMIKQIDNTQVRDVLNTLYLVVPSTRSVIVSSVRDEYCRLGDLSGLRDKVKGALEFSTTVIRDAYQFTAVANIYGCDLPFEILRAAVGFEWSESSDLLANNSAVWGVLYPIENSESISLRTRNQVVSDTIVNLVNGSVHSRLGEVRVLKKLIGACGGKSSLIYRNFIAKLLIGNEDLSRLGYDDGRELYEAATDALKAPDRSLIHHMGLWANKHNRSSEALSIYKEALNTPNYPYSERTESESNISTSMASAVLSEIKAGTKTLDEGKVEAEEYLTKARKGSFGDAHVVHISAGVTLQLINAMPEGDEIDKLHIASDAVGDIDKLEMIDESPIAFRKRSQKSQGLLLSAREKLYSAALPKGDQEQFAKEIWEKQKSQDGFVIVARKRLSDVRKNAGKGKEYKSLYEFIFQCRSAITEANRTVESRLSEVQAEVFYWWRIHRAMLSAQETDIAWTEFLEILSEVIRPNDNHGNQRWFQFLRGYALCQLGDWRSGERDFEELRRSDIPPNLLWLPRAYLLNDKGGRKTVQGTVKEYGGRTYLEVPDCNETFLTEKRDHWNDAGLEDHANIRFCFAGPRAVHDT